MAKTDDGSDDKFSIPSFAKYRNVYLCAKNKSWQNM